MFEYGNDTVLTSGYHIPKDEVQTEIEKGAASAGVSPREFKEAVVNSLLPTGVKE